MAHLVEIKDLRVSFKTDTGSLQVIRGVDVVEKFWRELDYLEFARRLEPVSAITKQGDAFTVVTADGEELPARSISGAPAGE